MSERDELMALRRMAELEAKAGGITPQEPLQQEFDRRKAGLGERIEEGGKQRFNQIQTIANQAGEGLIGDKEAALRIGLKTAQVPFDVAGEVATSAFRALPDFVENPIRQGASNVYSAVSSLPSMGGGTIGETIPGELQTFQAEHPVAAGRIGSALDVGNIVAGFLPVKGTNAVRASGVAGEKALKTTGRALDIATNPVRPDVIPEARMLENLGVRLTSGQRSGNGFFKGIEDKATSIPLVGDSIKNAQVRSIDDFNRVVADDVLSSLKTKLPKNLKTGRETVSYTYDTIGKSYDDVLSKMTGAMDAPLMAERKAAYAKAVGNLPPEKVKQVRNIIDNAIDLRLSGATIKAGDNKEIMKRLKNKAMTYSKSQDPDQQMMGEIFQDVHMAYSDMLSRHNPADLAQKLKDTDLAFAKYVRLEQAAGAQGAKEGIFTPSQLMGSVKRTDNSVRHGAFSRGDALMQELAEAGYKVLPNTYPDSGTAGRAMLGLAAAAGTGVAAPITIPALVAGGLAAAAYTRPGQAMIRGVSKAVRKSK